MSYWTSMTVEDVKEVAEMVTFIEQWLYVVMPTTHSMNPKVPAKTALDIGPENAQRTLRRYAWNHRHTALRIRSS